MSKLFSISMATVLMLMSLVGPTEPASVNGDASQEMAPISEEVSVDDVSDGEEVLVEESDDVQLAPVETGEVGTEDEALTPVEEPAENANAPPAGDDPDIEVQKTNDVQTNDAPEVETGNLISPSAIDPNPGDCPLGEICDGGGGDDTPAEVNISMVSYTGTYYFPNAVFTITDGTTTKTATADQYGWAHTKLTSGATYSVSVLVTGWGTASPVSITPTEPDNTYSFELTQIVPQTSAATFEVVDASSGEALVDAEVRLVFDRTWSFADSGETGTDGTWTSKPLTAGTYWASVSYGDQHYGQYDIEVTLPADGTVRVELQRINKSPISLRFVDAETGDPLEGVAFELAKEGHGTDVYDVSSASGEYTTESLEHGNYGLDAMKEGYGYVLDLRWDHPADGVVIVEMQPFGTGTGTRTFTLLDVDTGDPLADAYITIFEDSFGSEIVVGQTDENGQWTTPELVGGVYSTAIYPAAHYSTAFTFTVVSGNHPIALELEAFNDVGYLDVNVVNVLNGQPLQGVRITIREQERGVVDTGVTDAHGEWIKANSYAGHYVVTVEKTGFVTQVIDVSKTSGDYFLDVEMEMKGQWDLRFWLRLPQYEYPDWSAYMAVPSLGTTNGLMPIAFQTSGDYVPVVDARVQLLNVDTLKVVAETTSDVDGLVDLGSVTEGDYILRITGEGFEDYSEPLSVNGNMEFQLDLVPSQVSNPGDDDTPTIPEPGDGDDDTPTNPEPGDGDDDTPTIPEPGDGNDDTPTNPGPGDGDDDTPTIPEPGDGDDDTPTNPDEGTTPGADGEESDPVGETGVVEEPVSTGDSAVAQSAGASSDGSSVSVNQLPNTGAGESKSHVGIAALTLVAAFTLRGALGVRRRV